MEKIKKILFYLTAVALVAGLILSIVSSLELCTASCQEAHDYVFFGFSFDLLGILFFTGALITHFTGLSLFTSLLLAGALGAEVIFLFIQSEIIGQWCPICLSIFTTVVIACSAKTALYVIGMVEKKQQQGNKMLWGLFRGFGTSAAFIVGLTVALFGVTKIEKTFADGTSENEDPIFGNRESPIEIYIVSDWFCSACKELEPRLDKMLPQIEKRASVIFVDRNLHPESLNYMPYNLSFMLKNKNKYLQLRNALSQLTEETKTPTPQQVQQAIRPLGVKYKPLNFSDIDSGHRFFQGISETFKIDSTPTVVIANKKKVKAKKLVGLSEITSDNINLWIDKLSQ